MSNSVEPESSLDSAAGEPTSRRDLLKKVAVGATAAGIVWSAPKVEGLSLRPNYAAAGSGGGLTTAFATLRFRADAGTDLVFAAGTGQLGTTASGNAAFASVRGRWSRNAAPPTLTISQINWPGVGTAFVNEMNTGNNVGSPTPSINAATALDALSARYDAPIVSAANVHNWTVSFTCS